MQRLPGVIIITWIILAITSCANIKNFQYLQGQYDTVQISKVKVPEPIIQKDDLLGITVYSDDPIATAAVTNPMVNSSANAASSTNGASIANSAAGSHIPGYLVNQQGEIQLFKLGMIPAAGKTKKQLADTLTLLYSNMGLLKNPYVEVRFLNYKVTVIGEVNKPGPINIPTDKVSAFEAIGLAGDISQYGRRDNVLVIRETNGVRRFGRLNLKDPNVFLSPYYYLEQNDLVIVDVSKNKSAINNQSTLQTISIGATLLSVFAVIYSVLKR
jgi:polysaccharide export outer membrane protein